MNILGWETISTKWTCRDRLLVSAALTSKLYSSRMTCDERTQIAHANSSVCLESVESLERLRPKLVELVGVVDFDHYSRKFSGNCVGEKAHDHSSVIHGRSHQTDIYPDGSLVNP